MTRHVPVDLEAIGGERTAIARDVPTTAADERAIAPGRRAEMAGDAGVSTGA